MAPSGGLLQLFQKRTQPIEARVPELAVSVGPRGDLHERRGIELARARLRFSTAPDQARTLEDAQVLAHTAGPLMSNGRDSSFTFAGPAASRFKIARRVGSASAANVWLNVG
jgi:hypothetical protein